MKRNIIKITFFVFGLFWTLPHLINIAETYRCTCGLSDYLNISRLTSSFFALFLGLLFIVVGFKKEWYKKWLAYFIYAVMTLCLIFIPILLVWLFPSIFKV
ncbi:MAG TPA: hypothetical protein P5323_02330 [Candidatus Moranbacteria bacterium]|nr:hypothetical protein [Candidatus Moranbacteria bacterium]HRY27949.1 hypothetical protein [Candidatus Moranbacteria bacterium]HSA08235.1 hypothetical protein [Candidatus Moranbacteria bacterium]